MSDRVATASRRAASDTPSRLPPVVFGATAAVLAVTLLAIGGIPPAVGCAFGFASAALLGFTLWHQRGALSTHIPLVVVGFAVLAFFSLLQSIPLPLGLLRVLAPDNADIWGGVLTASGSLPPLRAPISLAPELTLIEAAKWGSYAVFAWVGYYWARTRGLEALSWLTLGLGLLAALVTVFHGLLHLQTLYGFYVPSTPYPRWRMGPLFNANHLAGYLSLSIYGGLSILLANREPLTARMAVVLAATTGLVLGSALLASRAGIVLLLVGALLLPLTFFQRKTKRRKPQLQNSRTALALGASVFMIGAAFALLGYKDSVLTALAKKDWSKLQVARDSVPLVLDHWRVGVGRGAFESVYFAYKTVGHSEFWSHPENLLVQWSSEWGLPVSLLGGGLLLVALARATSWRDSVAARVLLIGLVLITAHNLLDFSLEVPAVGGLTALLLGGLCGAPGGSADTTRLSPRSVAARSRTLLLAGGLGFALALVSFAAMLRRPVLLSEARGLAFARSVDPAARLPDTLASLDGWMRRFPAEPYFPLTAAIVVAQARPMAALPWFNRALERGPNIGRIHVALAEALGRAGFRSQALLEVRLGLERDEDVIGPAAALALRLGQSAADYIATAPLERPYSLAYLEAIARALPESSPSAVALREFVIERLGCAIALREVGVRELIDRISHGAAPCIGESGIDACRAQIEPQIATIGSCPGGRGPATMLTADLLWASGDQASSVKMLGEACAAQPGDMTACLQQLAERAGIVHDTALLRHTIRIVVSRRCQGPEACGKAWSWAAGVYTSAGDPASAYVAATKATELDPVSLELRRSLAESALGVGARDKAEAALRYVLQRSPGDPAATSRLAQILALPRQPPPAPAGAGSATAGAFPSSASGPSSRKKSLFPNSARLDAEQAGQPLRVP